ncbi:hypothetical protein HMPREF1982_02690 [Clostridiales bacterium oral taxon 876 str. F0540]|nr:hypothetical protein HMPREF1982_02690 [Clostridiales bacterium oral taxon 876 str. F0540]
MDYAYSLEYKDIVDAEKAYELYWEGIISDKQAFICPEPDCNAQITCSNIDKEKRFLKQKPHFRCYGNHKNNCPNDEEKIGVAGFDDGQERKNLGYIDPLVDVLLLKRKEKSPSITNNKPDIDNDYNAIKRRIKSDIETNGSRRSEYVTIMPIVTKFQKYIELGTTSNHYIENQGKNIKYSDMFINLDKGQLEWYSNFNRVHFGKAKVVKVKGKDDHFRLVFTKKLKFKDKEYIPNVYISNKIINSSYRNKKWLDELKELQQTGKEINAFIYGKVKINQVEQKQYFNIDICEAKLDFIDIRYEEENV